MLHSVERPRRTLRPFEVRQSLCSGKLNYPCTFSGHIARGWNKVPGSLPTCHKSLSWHFDNVGLTHPLLMYLSREGSDNAT